MYALFVNVKHIQIIPHLASLTFYIRSLSVQQCIDIVVVFQGTIIYAKYIYDIDLVFLKTKLNLSWMNL